MKHDVSIHINTPDLKVLVLNSEVTLALKHESDTFIGARLALFMGVVDTETIRKYFQAVKHPKTILVKKPVFGRVAEVRAIDRWNNPVHLQLFESVKSLMGRRFTERHAMRIMEVVSIGQFSFDETYLKELGYRLAVIRMNEMIRRQPQPKTAPAKAPLSRINWAPETDSKTSSSDDGSEIQRSTNTAMSTMFASPIKASYMDTADPSSSDGGSAVSSD